jgi:hypothetical protein
MFCAVGTFQTAIVYKKRGAEKCKVKFERCVYTMTLNFAKFLSLLWGEKVLSNALAYRQFRQLMLLGPLAFQPDEYE